MPTSLRASNTPQSRKSGRGITLLETLLAIAVGVTLIIGSVVLYQSATSKGLVQEAFSQIQSTVSGVRSLYSGSASYGQGTDITEVAVQAKVFENKWIDSAGQPINPWGGNVTITGANRTFIMTYAMVPQDSCALLIAQNSTGFGGSVASVKVNNQAISTQAIDPAAATAACNKANDNEIEWVLR